MTTALAWLRSAVGLLLLIAVIDYVAMSPGSGS
jgi:hypothetical protein